MGITRNDSLVPGVVVVVRGLDAGGTEKKSLNVMFVRSTWVFRNYISSPPLLPCRLKNDGLTTHTLPVSGFLSVPTVKEMVVLKEG